MYHLRRARLASALALAFGAPAIAQSTSSDLDTLRQEIKAMRADYESRLQALEQRLQAAETSAAAAPGAAAAAPAAAAAQAAPGAGTGEDDDPQRVRGVNGLPPQARHSAPGRRSRA